MSLAAPPAKYGLFESSLAAIALGGTVGGAVTGLQRAWDPSKAAPTVRWRFQCGAVQRTQSSFHISLI